MPRNRRYRAAWLLGAMSAGLTEVIALCHPCTAQMPAASQPATAAVKPRVASHRPRATQTALSLARSMDGLTFRETGQVLIPLASSPTLKSLPNGTLLAVFDYPAERLGGSRPAGRSATADSSTVLATSRSTDNGRTWSRPRAIRLATGQTAARHGFLMNTPDGKLRLYFVTEAAAKPGGGVTAHEVGTHAAVRSAITSNGLDYALDDAVRLELRGLEYPYVCAARLGGRVHLYAGDLASERRRPDGRGARAERETIGLHFESADGRRFTAAPPVNVAGVLWAGDVHPLGRYLRAYISTLGGGIGSLLSENGRDWRAEAGLRIGYGCRPAVAQARDGSSVMLYTIEIPERESRRDTLVRRTAREQTVGDAQGPSVTAQQPGDQQVAGGGAVVASVGEVSAGGRSGEDAAADDGSAANMEAGAAEGAWEPFAKAAEAQGDMSANRPGATVPPPPDASGAAPEAAEGGLADAAEQPGETTDRAASGDGQPFPPDNTAASSAKDGKNAGTADSLGNDVDTMAANANISTASEENYDPSDPFPPPPNFNKPVDYRGWYKSRCEAMVNDNAFELYKTFLPMPNDQPGSKPQMPTRGMLLDADSGEHPPGPWDPAAHPEWEADRQATAAVVEQFREATRHSGFAREAGFDKEESGKVPGGKPPLLMMLLPDLSAHRALTKQAISDAWRMEDGKVSAEKMMDAWQTALGSANHMHQGTTLIENLVGTAEQMLVEQHARWALKQGVFSGDQLDSALSVLAQHDRNDSDPGMWLNGEHAFAMDTLQFMFKSDKPGDPPKLDMERANYFTSQQGFMTPEIRDKLAKMTPDDIKKSTEAMDHYYREASAQFREGYPTVRSADIDATTQKYLHTSAFTEFMLPAISRAHQLRARNEASRRATQLSYAVHAYHARSGQWPASLSDLPAEYGATMRTDPFTGGYFGYRVGKEGPVIYSLSENGRDDGGKHSHRWGDEKEGESDDYVFWPPQQTPR